MPGSESACADGQCESSVLKTRQDQPLTEPRVVFRQSGQRQCVCFCCRDLREQSEGLAGLRPILRGIVCAPPRGQTSPEWLVAQLRDQGFRLFFDRKVNFFDGLQTRVLLKHENTKSTEKDGSRAHAPSVRAGSLFLAVYVEFVLFLSSLIT